MNRSALLEDVLRRISDATGKAAPAARLDAWINTCCPAHDDGCASLGVKAGDRCIMFKCQAGCSTESVARAIGMTPPQLKYGGAHFGKDEELTSLDDLARAKGLPLTFLQAEGWEYRADNRLYSKRLDKEYASSGVLIPYRQEDGSLAPRNRLRKKSRASAKHSSFWTGRQGDGPLIPYGVDRLQAAREVGMLILCEGETDAVTLWHHGFHALGIPGASAETTLQASHVAGISRIFVISEPDQAGRRFPDRAGKRLKQLGWMGELRVITMPEGTKDPNDLHRRDAAAFKTRWQEMIDSAPVWTPDEKTEAAGDANDDEAEKRKSATAQMVEAIDDLISDGLVELFHEPGAEPRAYASLMTEGRREVYLIRSEAFRRWLRRQVYAKTRLVPNGQAVADAVATLEATAVFAGPERPVGLRVMEHDGAVFIDLGRSDWSVVEITGNGWRVVERPPVFFRRARGMEALPVPVRGGEPDDLRPFVNVEAEDFPLVVAWLVATLRPSGPYPLGVLSGEQGSGKSMTARILRSLTDPNAAPIRAEPKEPRDLMIAAVNGHVLCFDNLSRVQPWLSDALCRLSTGGGWSARQLYTDGDEFIIDVQRPVILTGIDDGLVTRSDLADRCIVLRCPTIPERRRRTEASFWHDFGQLRGRIFGWLLDCLATALRRLPEVKLEKPPRMADFAAWAVAAEPAFGCEPGAFLKAYERKRSEVNAEAVAGWACAAALDRLLEVGGFEGTAGDLLRALEGKVEEHERDRPGWPKTARGLRSGLQRVAPNLRALGVEVTYSTARTRRGSRITIQRTPKCDGRGDGCDGRGFEPSHAERRESPKGAAGDGGDGCDGSAPTSAGVCSEGWADL